MDDDAGGYLAARHLLDTGRRRLAFVGGPTSIRQPTEALGHTAIELLAEELESDTPKHWAVIFSPELVVRQSTAPAETSP